MRTRTLMAACTAIGLGLTVGVSAQTSATTSTQRSSTTSADKVMVTGCIERATPSPTGTTGTRGASSSDFVLQHAMMSTTGASSTAAGTTSSTARTTSPGASASTTTSSPGTAGTTGSPSSTAGKEYELDATAAQLSQHVGHKVEITGTIEAPGASATARTNPPSASASASTSGGDRLKVDSVRMISTTCS